MGVIISRFRIKSPVDQLQNLEEEIKELEACNADTKLRHQKITRQLYYIVNKLISRYYNRKIASSRSRLNHLKNEKKRLLDEIMDKETYKVAKEILEKYAPEALQQKYPTRFGPGSPAMPQTQMRNILPNIQPNRSQPSYMMNQGNKPFNNMRLPGQARSGQHALLAFGPMQKMQSFVRDKGYVERIMEYLVGDGPNNRYALICGNCSTHNGMALQEEFEYTAFKCYSCFTLNPARKQRPTAPKLDSGRSKDTPESDSCSSSVSGDQSGVKIEEVEDDEREEGSEKCPDSGGVKKLEEDLDFDEKNPFANDLDEEKPLDTFGGKAEDNEDDSGERCNIHKLYHNSG